MLVRGAPLIGATAAYGMALAMRADRSDAALDRAYETLLATRPTAINLKWALDEMRRVLQPLPPAAARAAAYARAAAIADEDVAINQSIGRHGLALIEAIARQEEAGRARQHSDPLQRRLARHRRLGHRDGADLSRASIAGLDIHVWVDETRPRNQGASLTAWELGHHGVPHTVIPDNTGGHLMQHGMVDLVHRRHRPRHRLRRRLQQDRHLSEGAGGARQRRAVLRRAAVADHRLHHRRRRPRNSDRAARRRRSDDDDRAHRRAAGSRRCGSCPKDSAGGQLRLRRHAGAAGHRD